MSKYEIGDIVLIKQNVETIIPLTHETASIMKRYEGKEATITQTDVNAFLGKSMYKLDIDNGLLVWDESVLAPAQIEIGDRVRITDTIPELSNTSTSDLQDLQGSIKSLLQTFDHHLLCEVKLDVKDMYICIPAKGLQKISNPKYEQSNKKNNVKNKEEEIMISDYRVEDCTIFDKTYRQHIKGKRTMLEWTDGTVTTVECPESEFNAYIGFAIALAKKAMGNDNTMNKLADYWINKLPAKNAKMQSEIEKCKAEELRIAEKKKVKKEKWETRKAVLARKRAYEEIQKQRAIAEIAEREFGVPISFKNE
ncbi:MAG: hypothetical protein NC485_10455 [Ruminococcus flavefaciens]|nr:hypothetical protein [Ruminococcus flavefaciens]MCM1060739.1 hypothetical protein [Eubacterium sp.]